MKRSKFTTFLFSVSLGLFVVNIAFSQNSTDCRDEVNISVGVYNDSVGAAIAYQAFTTSEPSCLIILDAFSGDTITQVGMGCPNPIVMNSFSETVPIAKWYDNNVPATGSGSPIPAGECSAEYTYHSYTSGGNYCWGKVNFHYKISDEIPAGTSVMDTCSNYVTYSRPNYIASDYGEAKGLFRALSEIEDSLNPHNLDCYSVTSSVNKSGDICEGIQYIRMTTVDHENAHVADYAGPTDTVTVVAGEFFWPDTVIAVSCNKISDLSPVGIAEYIAESGSGLLEKFGSDEVLCDTFVSQYLADPSVLTTCAKIKENADFNNVGVARAFPYVINSDTLIDQGLKEKLDALDASGDLDTSLTADHYKVPYLKVPINTTVCNWAATYWDHNIDICNGESKILRRWEVVNWCNGSIETFAQTIHVIDDEGPSIYVADDFTAKADDPWSCTYAYTIPAPNVYDACGVAGVTSVTLNGDPTAIGKAVKLGLGWNLITYTASDDCGNTSENSFDIYIIDKFPPVMVCEDELNVTLTGTADNGGTAKVTADMLDAGSFAGCGDSLAFKVVRKSDIGDLRATLIAVGAQADSEARITNSGKLKNAGLVDKIELDCDDVGSVDVVLFAWNTNTNYYSWCWTTVTVENKLPPVIVCTDVALVCGASIHPDWTGYPHAYAVCGEVDFTWEDEASLDDLCYTGNITRTWTDNTSGAQCVQTITITDDGNAAFDPTTIKWPLHNTGESLDDMDFPTAHITIYDENAHEICTEFSYSEYELFNKASDDDYDIEKDVLKGCKMDDAFYCTTGQTNEPTWTDPTCGLVGMTSSDEEFTFNDGVCYKILRHWVVIDWCTYDPKGHTPKNGIGDKIGYVKDRCIGDAYFAYTSAHQDGYYEFTQEIKVVDDTPPVITGATVEVEVGAGAKANDSACEGSTTVTATAEDFCAGDLVDGAELNWEVTVEAGSGSGKITAGSMSNGGNDAGEVPSNEGDFSSHSVTVSGAAGDVVTLKWRVTDGCNNVAEAVTTVTFTDTKAPVILCIGELSTSTMNTDGSTEIWANDFAEAYDCDGKEAYVWFRAEDGALVPGLSFDCSDLDGNSSTAISLQVIATDAAGNESYCNVSLRIVDGDNTCGNDGNTGASVVIAGEVRTEEGDMVESAIVSMKEDNMMTSTDGAYAFSDNPIGFNYEIKAKKSDDHLNGVSTLDLVLIQKHILGLESLSSPYKVIAADINNDENVSAIDLVQLRKLILGIYEELPSNDSWRFADANATFADVNNPFPFTESINVDFLTERRMDEDFIAIKIGDVSGNAIANSLIANGRNNASLTLTALDAQVSAGQSVRVAIRSDEFEEINALQFTMALSGLKYTAIESGELEMTDDNVAVFEGRMTAAWYNVDAVSTDETLFTLVFTALENTTLSNAISIGSEITKAEAYNSNNEGADIALAFETGEGLVNGSTFELFQNKPNPFDNITTIGFQLAEAGAAKMTVFDVTGKIVTTRQGQYDRGYNQITLNKADLDASGVLYYQLESGEFTATRKMILID